MRLTRRLTFHATHRMALPRWSEEENRERFGWTAEPPGHGHLYRVAITVGGPLDAETGTVVDLAALDTLLEREVVAPFSGRHLNEALPLVAAGESLPSCEALAAEIWRRVTAGLPERVTLVRVTVAEDDSLEAECLGPS